MVPLELGSFGSLIPLAPCAKIPLIKWKRFQNQNRRPTEEELRLWQERWPDCNWALVPSEELIILDVDSQAGLTWLSKRGGIPLTPIALTKRGQHIYLKRPKELWGKELPTKLHKGIEIVQTYAVLPGSTHPDGFKYQWLISPQEVEMAEPHPWLTNLLLKKARGRGQNNSKIRSKINAFAIQKLRPWTRTTRAKSKSNSKSRARASNWGRAIRCFIEDILPHAKATDSNAPKLLAAGIVAYRIEKQSGEKLISTMVLVNEELPQAEQVSLGRLQAIARCIEERNYGFSARTYAERTLTPLPVARLIYSFVRKFDRMEREPVYMSSAEITRRLQRTIAKHGRWLSKGICMLETTISKLSALSGINAETIKTRIRKANTPLLWITTFNGVGITAIYAWNIVAISVLGTYVKLLKKYRCRGGITGGRGKGVGPVDVDVFSRTCFEARAGP